MAKNENPEVVVPKEEVNQIKTLQEKYQTLALQLGQASIQRTQLNRELENVETNEQKLHVAYDECREEEQNLVKSMTEKY